MCVILAWGCQVAELNNVTVLDRDGGLPSVGEGQSSINLKKLIQEKDLHIISCNPFQGYLYAQRSRAKLR